MLGADEIQVDYVRFPAEGDQKDAGFAFPSGQPEAAQPDIQASQGASPDSTCLVPAGCPISRVFCEKWGLVLAPSGQGKDSECGSESKLAARYLRAAWTGECVRPHVSRNGNNASAIMFCNAGRDFRTSRPRLEDRFPPRYRSPEHRSSHGHREDRQDLAQRQAHQLG
jgi:hypothetical protein